MRATICFKCNIAVRGVWLACGLVFAVPATEVGAQPFGGFALYSGAELFIECEKPTGADGLCAGFVAGAVDTLVATDALLLEKKFLARRTFCPPPGMTLGGFQAVVVRYLKDNPREHHFLAASLVTAAVQRAFPCEAK